MKSNDENELGINVYSSKDNQSLHKSLNGEFTFYQILFQQILDENKFFPKRSSTISKYFQPDNPTDQKIMNEFDNEYKSDKAIHWFTRQNCIYNILNKALKTQNIDDIIPFQHFIRDLNKQLIKEQISFIKKQKTKTIQVYRRDFLNKDQMTRLKSTIGQLISINSFLLTTTNKEKALELTTDRSTSNDQFVSILLQIDLDFNAITRPYADIKHFTDFPEEEQILFMFGCVFRIKNIDFDQEFNIWKAKLILCSQNDQDFKEFLDNLEKELERQNKFISIGNYFIQMQKYEEAEEHFQQILKNKFIYQPIERAYAYFGLSQVNLKKGDLNSTIANINKTLNNIQNDDQHPLISLSYNYLADIYFQQNNYLQALQFYEKALKTTNNISTISYQGLAQIHFKLQNYILSKEYLEKARENQPATADAAIAKNYIDMAKIYVAINQNDKAAEMFDKAIESQTKLLGENHPDIGDTYNALGLMYLDINDLEKAFQYIEKAYQLQLESLPNNHSDFAQTYQYFGDLYMKKEEFDQALSYYHKTLENQLKTLLWSHTAVAQTYLTIGSVHFKENEYDDALICYHKVLDSELVRQKSGDISLSNSFKRLGDLYYCKGDISNSLIYYHKQLDNELEIKLYEDISLSNLYKILGDIYYEKNLLKKSLIYYNRLLDCYLPKQIFYKKTIEEIYKMIGKIYLKKVNLNERLSFYEKLKLNKSQDIEKIYFEKRHLDETFIYFENYLNEQLKFCSDSDLSIDFIYQILGNICLEKRNFDSALNYFIKLLNNKLKIKTFEDSSLSNLYEILGEIYYEKGLYNESLICLNRLIDCQLLFNKFDYIYRFIGKIYLKKDCLNQSSNYINKLIQNTRKTNKFKLFQTNFQFEKRHLEQNLIFFQKLLKTKSFEYFSYEQICFIIGNLFLEKQDFNRGLIYFKELLNYLNQFKPFQYFSLGKINEIIANIYQKQSNSNQALQHYQQSLSLYSKIFSSNQYLIYFIKYQINQIIISNKQIL